jgi:hypothetical protein
MSEKEGTLRKQPSGRWAVFRPGRDPVEITSGEPHSRDTSQPTTVRPRTQTAGAS